MNRIAWTFFLVFISLVVRAQRESYPKNYFIFPINPGQTNTLAGVLGDLRTNHYHGGLDIRTQQREGLPVHAAADGYVYKVAVQGTGYGNVIYLKHPNGLTTVYGHLKTFSDTLARYVRSEQYKKQDFYVELYPAPGQFVFKKGQVMAASGNTGGSAGPHLHFEVRDSRDNYLNPLYFNFDEIKDTTPPAFWNVALRPSTLNSRVNGQFDRQVFKPIKQKNGTYVIPSTIRGTGQIGIELQAYDYMTGTGFRYGLHCIEIRMDGQEIFTFNMEKFPVTATRDYNNLIDYRTDQETGARFYKCYNPDGNSFELFKTDGFSGRLVLNDTLTHQISIKIFDAYENSSQLTFTMKGELNAAEIRDADSTEAPIFAGSLSADSDENTLKIEAAGNASPGTFATFFTDRRRVQQDPSYIRGTTAVFLTDLRTLLPDSVQVGSKVLPLNYRKSIPPAKEMEFLTPNWGIRFDSTSLFDTLHLSVIQRFNTISVNEPTLALRGSVQVRFKPEGTFTRKERTGVYRYYKNDYRYLGGNWTGDFLAFKTRELGQFVAMTDSIPPKVRLIEHSSKHIRGYIQDDLSGIDTFRARVNGEWVLMNYEYKNRYIWSEKLDESQLFEGELTLEVTDRAGNSTILQVEIKEPVTKPTYRKPKRK
ncbi:M23 family metallopeptidase [Arundinibacter roseus]|uniref:M23 family metallopeptidase n=1 Tax=Arundinibacter roseus TaxID=2070510 RepID=A0A4R4KCQ7_9BACT|nr:M23 family metallopeptidase [Arundinibacter roseus]TDB64622.1 M23 family metallopeptidase [Arundinibacter roseus]